MSNPVEIFYDDTAYWAEYSTNPHKFRFLKKQCEKLMGITKKITDEHIANFRKTYCVLWKDGDEFQIKPR